MANWYNFMALTERPFTYSWDLRSELWIESIDCLKHLKLWRFLKTWISQWMDTLSFWLSKHIFFSVVKREVFRGLYSEFKVFRARIDDSRGLFCGGSSRPPQLRLYLSSYRFQSFVNAVTLPSRYLPTFSKTFQTFLRSFFVNDDDINRILM